MGLAYLPTKLGSFGGTYTIHWVFGIVNFKGRTNWWSRNNQSWNHPRSKRFSAGEKVMKITEKAGLICKGFTLICGCFLKWWYPQITHFNRVFHYKPSILGYHHFRKPPYVDVCVCVFLWHTIDWYASYSSKIEVTCKSLMLFRVLYYKILSLLFQ